MRLMWDVLSALIPPVVVATVFCVAIYTLLRKEMAPRTSDGRPVEEESTDQRTPDDKAAAEDRAKEARSASEEVRERGEESGGS